MGGGVLYFNLYSTPDSLFIYVFDVIHGPKVFLLRE